MKKRFLPLPDVASIDLGHSVGTRFLPIVESQSKSRSSKEKIQRSSKPRPLWDCRDIPGDEVIARVAADPSSRKPAIVVNTAFHEGAVQVKRAITAGAALMLHKPTSLKTFQTIALRYLSANRTAGTAHGISAKPRGRSPLFSQIASRLFRSAPRLGAAVMARGELSSKHKVHSAREYRAPLLEVLAPLLWPLRPSYSIARSLRREKVPPQRARSSSRPPAPENP